MKKYGVLEKAKLLLLGLVLILLVVACASLDFAWLAFAIRHDPRAFWFLLGLIICAPVLWLYAWWFQKSGYEVKFDSMLEDR